MSKKNVLIVIDMQNDFITGPLGTEEARKIVEGVANRINLAETYDEDVYYTLDTHDYDYLTTKEGKWLAVEHCIYETAGWCLEQRVHRALDVLSTNKRRVTKAKFGYTNWNNTILTAPEKITIVGVCTDICVLSNALILRATFPNADIIVREDLCAGTTPENHKAAIKMLQQNCISIHSTHTPKED